MIYALEHLPLSSPIPIPPVLAAVQHVVDIAQIGEEYVDAQCVEMLDASEKRRREFAAGRLCAERCLEAHRRYDVEVPVATDRSPVWPPGFVGSISHSDKIAWAVVASQERMRSVGIDCEQIVHDRTVEETLEQIADPTELARLQALGLTRVAAFTLIFSAKEAIYKCLYPIGIKSLGFRDVRVLGVDEHEVDACLPISCASVRGSLRTQYAFDRDHVFTMCTLRA